MSDVDEQARRYVGSCHCQAIRFEVSLAESGGMSCNCSICSRAGWLLAFVPAAGFRLLSEDSSLQDYQFGKKKIHHPFCSVCGVRSYGWGTAEDGSKMYSVNLRCLDGFDVAGAQVQAFDGASL